MFVYINPKSVFPPLHSDTIFGSILYALNQLYPDEFNSLLLEFKNQDDIVPFLVSSAFPFINTDVEKIQLFPLPIEKPVNTDLDLDSAKKFKKISYIEESIFRSWISGKVSEKEIVDNMDDYKIIGEEFLFERDPDINFQMNSAIIPRNTINRVTNASENIFYSSGVNFSNVGLFFMVRFYYEEYKDLVINALKFLKDRGFGGDISVGKGHFDFEIDEKEILKEEGDRFTTLSRYIPTLSEVQAFKNNSWFEIGSKRGRSSRGSFRRQVRFFKEGSTFPDLKKEVYGRLVETEKDAVEYGFAYNVGLKI